LSWFLREDNAKTTPILRFAQEQALRVKPMLGRRAYARAKYNSTIAIIMLQLERIVYA